MSVRTSDIQFFWADIVFSPMVCTVPSPIDSGAELAKMMVSQQQSNHWSHAVFVMQITMH
jgi:hypothetical protein